MNAEQWARVKELFHAALTIPDDERERFLERATSNDSVLSKEVRSLLAANAQANGFSEPVLPPAEFIETPALEMLGGHDPSQTRPPTDQLNDLIGRTLTHYRVIEKLGSGGMGEVYAAEDVRLGRRVAIKLLLESSRRDPIALERLQREARAASSLNHPNICTVFDIGADGGVPFVVMELLDGSSLAARLRAGPMSISEAVPVCLGVLAALDALHSRGLVHRDIKPSNVFLTPHGAKLLDFGLAKSMAISRGNTRAPTGDITQSGLVIGTPQYMSPEQSQGAAVDARSDTFSMGAVLFEMLSGRPAFSGRTIPELFHQIVFEQPASLAQPAPVRAIVSRALAKRPADRFQSATVMAEQLRTLLSAPHVGATDAAPSPSRIIVLPFYQHRSDPDIAFLSFSLPDAISASLAGLRSIVVRSSRVASRYVSLDIDLKELAEDAGVDAVVTGTLLRMGARLRASIQLVEVPSGTMIWTDTADVGLDDIFQLQDQLAKRIVESLSGPLTERERALMSHDVPASPRAYEFYLRANHLSNRVQDLTLARELYQRSLEADPNYAPAWARLGRCFRVRAKYGDDPLRNMQRAADAFKRAFTLNPDLPTAHSLYAQQEAEQGHADDALSRLLNGVHNNPNDPELYAGLVHVCRYCGLLDASLAAHQRALRLDPNTRTTVMNTHFVMGNFQLVVDAGADEVGYVEAMALDAMGRRDEARNRLWPAEKRELPPLIRKVVDMLKLLLDGERQRAVESLHGLNLEGADPEGYFYRARLLAQLGEPDAALVTLEQAVRKGFWCVPALRHDTFLAAVRNLAGFSELLAVAMARAASAARAFGEGGGPHALSAN
jgi:serine/threonine protein kinase/tetratricopeptide (TPR) repeat protein